MTEISIDRLSLKLSGLSAGEGERLARLIADGLGRQKLTGSGHSVEGMTISINSSGGNLQRLSEQIVREIVRQF
jgi:hypothetical protein